ncbi:hypothetical protein Hanom_Chr11g01037191 [Helianthus anomalus]
MSSAQQTGSKKIQIISFVISCYRFASNCVITTTPCVRFYLSITTSSNIGNGSSQLPSKSNRLVPNKSGKFTIIQASTTHKSCFPSS